GETPHAPKTTETDACGPKQLGIRLWDALPRVRELRLIPFRNAGSRGSASLRAPESAHQQWGGSPHRTEHWLSVVEGNCVVERRGGRQPETNCQSINKTMLNTIRPDALASLRRVSEAQNRTPTREGQGNFGDLFQRRDSERRRRNAWGGW